MDIVIDIIASVEITIAEAEVVYRDLTLAKAHWRPDQKVIFASTQMQRYSSIFAVTVSSDSTVTPDTPFVILLFPPLAWTSVLQFGPYQLEQELLHSFVYLH